MKVEKSQELPAAIWRLGKWWSYLEAWEPGLNASLGRMAWGLGGPRAKDQCPSPGREKQIFPFFFFFFFVQALNSLDEAHPQQEGKLLYSVTWKQCSSLPETTPQNTHKIMFNQISGHPVIPWSWHTKLHNHAIDSDAFLGKVDWL